MESIAIIGTDTARLSYYATPSVPAYPGEHNPLRFKDPLLRYDQILRFERVPDGHWRLSGWPNYLAVKRALEANVVPSSLVKDFWWWESTPPRFD